MILLKYVSDNIKFLLCQFDHIINYYFFYTLYFFKSENE